MKENNVQTDIPEGKITPVLRVVDRALRLLMRYHRYEVVGLENFPLTGPVLVILSHSFATYEAAMLGSVVFHETGRLQWSVADKLFFKIPWIKNLMPDMQWAAATSDECERILAEGKTLWILPGGMQEALRPYPERYSVSWEKRKGFIKLALKTGAPVVLGACPSADDIFSVYPSSITRFAYDNFKVPLAFFRGVGPTLIPRPVKLKHHLSKPIQPPRISGEFPTATEVDSFHRFLTGEMNRLIAEARF